jgi:hypothetical protein
LPFGLFSLIYGFSRITLSVQLHQAGGGRAPTISVADGGLSTRAGRGYVEHLLGCHRFLLVILLFLSPARSVGEQGSEDAGATPVTVAKAYRLLKAVLNTAVDDGLIRRNPCRIKGASQEKSPERPVLSMRDIGALADAIDQRYHALVLLAIFGSLRSGELAALRRRDIDLEARTVRVSRQVTTLSSGRQVLGAPKSAAGNRFVVVPESSFLRCSYICAGWPSRAKTACCSPVLKERRCGMTTSATVSGTPRSRPRACRAFISTICGTQAISSPPMPGPRCAS